MSAYNIEIDFDLFMWKASKSAQSAQSVSNGPNKMVQNILYVATIGLCRERRIAINAAEAFGEERFLFILNQCEPGIANESQ